MKVKINGVLEEVLSKWSVWPPLDIPSSTKGGVRSSPTAEVAISGAPSVPSTAFTIIAEPVGSFTDRIVLDVTKTRLNDVQRASRADGFSFAEPAETGRASLPGKSLEHLHEYIYCNLYNANHFIAVWAVCAATSSVLSFLINYLKFIFYLWIILNILLINI